MLFCIYNKCGRNYRLLERESAAMNRNIEKWLENNPPRVELTELEKSLDPKDFDEKKHVIYTDLVSGVDIYRLRLAMSGETESWPWFLTNMNEGSISFLKEMDERFGINFLGYSYDDIMTVNQISGESIVFID